MPYLMQKKADGTLIKQWDLTRQSLTVGRGEKVDAQIVDGEMSRLHFVIEPRGIGWVITDKGSKNGTFVNSQKISETELNPGDRIRAGQSHFVFVEGLSTVIGKLEQQPKGLKTFIREISEPPKK